MQGRLAARLEAGLKAWTRILQKESKDEEDVDRHGYGHRHVRWADIDTDAPVQSAHKPGGEPKLKVLTKLFPLKNDSFQVYYFFKFIEYCIAETFDEQNRLFLISEIHPRTAYNKPADVSESPGRRGSRKPSQ